MGRVVAVSSGKGGVGKSTVSVNLAAALAAQGHRVGLLDADVYGPNVPTMLGEKRKPKVTGTKGAEKIEALVAHGVRLMSLGLLLEEAQPAIMRGPLKLIYSFGYADLHVKDRVRLYDLQEDPEELQDLSRSKKDITSALLSELKAAIEESNRRVLFPASP